jgi:hypothetical protein
MRWDPAPLMPLVLLAAVPAVHAEARIFLSVEQAQKKLFGGTSLKQAPVVLTEAQTEKMRAASSVRKAFRSDRIWRAPDGSWFIVDEVLGKHEMITYALVLNPDLSVRQIEVLEYHESYGYEVAEPSWRQQFVGKTPASTLKLGEDIRNVSGATLSCKHLTDGVKRLMVMADMVLRTPDGK